MVCSFFDLHAFSTMGGECRLPCDLLLKLYFVMVFFRSLIDLLCLYFLQVPLCSILLTSPIRLSIYHTILHSSKPQLARLLVVLLSLNSISFSLLSSFTCSVVFCDFSFYQSIIYGRWIFKSVLATGKTKIAMKTNGRIPQISKLLLLTTTTTTTKTDTIKIWLRNLIQKSKNYQY